MFFFISKFESERYMTLAELEEKSFNVNLLDSSQLNDLLSEQLKSQVEPPAAVEKVLPEPAPPVLEKPLEANLPVEEAPKPEIEETPPAKPEPEPEITAAPEEPKKEEPPPEEPEPEAEKPPDIKPDINEVLVPEEPEPPKIEEKIKIPEIQPALEMAKEPEPEVEKPPAPEPLKPAEVKPEPKKTSVATPEQVVAAENKPVTKPKVEKQRNQQKQIKKRADNILQSWNLDLAKKLKKTEDTDTKPTATNKSWKGLSTVNQIISTNKNIVGKTMLSGKWKNPELSPVLLRKYLPIVNEAIKPYWHVPVELDPTLQVLVKVLVAKDGRILSIEPIETSGSKLFDQAVKNVFSKIEKLPPLPEAFPGEFTEIGLRFTSSL